MNTRFSQDAHLAQQSEARIQNLVDQRVTVAVSKAVAEVEKKIAAVENEIAQLELSFQNPATGTDWESTHRRYSDLKIILEQLYGDLARHWELMEQ